MIDRDLARLMLISGFRSARELNELLFVLKEHCSADDYERLRGKIADAIAEINAATLSEAFDAHPDLHAEVDATIKKYGRFS